MTKKMFVVALAIVILAVLIMSRVAGGQESTMTEPVEPPDTIQTRHEAIVGDSLIAYSQNWDEYQYMNPSLRIWAQPGAGYGDEDPWIETLNPTPEVLFIAMGANNVNPLYGGDGWTLADIQKHMHMIYDARRSPGVIPCIVLVTVAPAPDAPLDYRYHAGRANIYLRDKAQESPVFRLADWASRASGKSAWFSDQLVHLNATGDQAYFDLLQSVASTC
jgi:hypothetical protein